MSIMILSKSWLVPILKEVVQIYWYCRKYKVRYYNTIKLPNNIYKHCWSWCNQRFSISLPCFTYDTARTIQWTLLYQRFLIVMERDLLLLFTHFYQDMSNSYSWNIYSYKYVPFYSVIRFKWWHLDALILNISNSTFRFTDEMKKNGIIIFLKEYHF